MGQAFGDLGMTGQQGLMNQMEAFNRMGGVGRGIQGDMYGAQYGAAQQMAQEPWQRMGQWGGMMQNMLPSQQFGSARTTFKSDAGTNPFMGLLSLLMGSQGGG
jgi:hypothetical protein